MALPSFFQVYAWGANTNRNGINSNSYTLRLANIIGAGNVGILIIDTTNANTFTSVVDNSSTVDTWSNTPTVTCNSGAGGIKTSVLVLTGLHAGPAGGSVITVNLGTSDANFKAIYIELYNVGAVGVTGNSTAGTAPNLTSPSVTATAGSMLLHYAIDNSALIGNGGQALSGFTPSGTPIVGDLTFGANASMAYYLLQYATATGSAQTMTATFTGGTHACNQVIFEIQAGANGVAPVAGIHIDKVVCFLNGNISASPWKVFMPNTGNLLAVLEDDGSLRAAPTDTVGSTWTLDVSGTTAPVSGAAHAQGLSPSTSRIISFAVSSLPQNTNYFCFDISGAGNVVQTKTFPVTAEGTSWSGTVAITPTVKNGLILNFAGTGIGPILTQTAPTTPQSFPIFVNYTNQTDADDMDNANAMSITYNGSSLAAQSYSYTIAVATSINATALEISPYSPPIEDEDFWAGGLPRPDPPISNISVW